MWLAERTDRKISKMEMEKKKKIENKVNPSYLLIFISIFCLEGFCY